jgi:tetratricopeptide (TPR) repeat protein
LEIRGNLHREMGNHELARDDYREAIDQLEDRPDRYAQIGRLHAGLGASYDAMRREDKAGQHWHAACLNHGRRRTGCSKGGHNDFPALWQPRGPQGQRQRIGARVHANAVRNLQIPGERSFEACHRRPKNVVTPSQDFLHGGHEGLLVSTQTTRGISLRHPQRRGDA